MLAFEPAHPGEADVALLLTRHFDLMRAQTPPESCHVLPAEALSAPGIMLFALRRAGRAVAVGALRVNGTWAEVKSMHTMVEERGQGHGRALLRRMIDAARDIEIARLMLETGAGPEHEAARALYLSEGFEPCPPFGDYVEDPLSVFMVRAV
jgi:putative acetyltransferase